MKSKQLNVTPSRVEPQWVGRRRRRRLTWTEGSGHGLTATDGHKRLMKSRRGTALSAHWQLGVGETQPPLKVQAELD